MDPPDCEVPLCTRCLEPVRPIDHYCDRCGQAVGRFTTYLPFVHIRFLADFLGAIWHWAWNREHRLPARLGVLLMLIPLAPFLFLGLPFVLFGRLRRTRTD